ncbi:MAG: hypothetical protein ACLPSO_12855 [Terracidiphilus sp.]
MGTGRMRAGLRLAWGAGLLLAAASTAWAQLSPHSGAEVMLSSGGLASVETLGLGVQGDIVREIDDPHTGDRWLLVRNDLVPGGPGRLVLVAAHRKLSGGAILHPAGEAREAEILPVIRSGDRLIVEEHTARVDAVLEARALSPAALGSALDVRLAIGGNRLRAIALGPGRAALRGIRP